MILPYQQLSPQALRGLIEDWVSRDGTDSGYAHKSLEKDVEAVLAQLKRGDVVITYDSRTQSAAIIPAADLPTPSP